MLLARGAWMKLRLLAFACAVPVMDRAYGRNWRAFMPNVLMHSWDPPHEEDVVRPYPGFAASPLSARTLAVADEVMDKARRPALAVPTAKEKAPSWVCNRSCGLPGPNSG